VVRTIFLEVRDAATFIPVFAIGFTPGDGYGSNSGLMYKEEYLARRCGYSLGELSVMVGRLAGGQATADPYDWKGSRTMTVAHDWIHKHFHELNSGDVVDVEFILGLRSEAKVSERVEFGGDL